MSSEARFGYEWSKYSFLDSNYEAQFKNWVSPLSLEFFKGKKVLDAGCGMGRNSYWPLKWGASELTAFDYDSRSVESARRTLKEFKNARVLFKSIYDLSWQNEFDIVFSIGVIHHLKEPVEALKKIVEVLKPGGTLIVWVYSYEGNEWIKKYVNPIRKSLTSKLPVGLVHWLSYGFSIPLWLFVKIFKGPRDYFKQLATFKFWHIHSIVFDQLIPEVANYWTKDEVGNLFKELGLKDFRISRPPNNCGWTIIAKK